METLEEKKTTGTQRKNWMQVAEVRMLMYVIPVGITLALIGLFLSQYSYR
jgi:hypothetical protein